MTTLGYEEILQAAQQLPPEDQHRLVAALTAGWVPSGATLVRALDTDPPDAVAWAEIERIIEDECERIDPTTW